MTGVLTPLRAPFERFGDVESQGLAEWWVHVERGVWLVAGLGRVSGPIWG